MGHHQSHGRLTGKRFLRHLTWEVPLSSNRAGVFSLVHETLGRELGTVSAFVAYAQLRVTYEGTTLVTEVQGTNDQAKYGFMAAANFIVTDTPAGGGSAPGAAGGFYLSREDMLAELENLKQLRIRIDAQIERSRPMWSIQSPGQDPASLRNTDASNNSGRYYDGHLKRQSGYLTTIIDKMTRALGITENADEQAGTDIAKQGGGRF